MFLIAVLFPVWLFASGRSKSFALSLMVILFTFDGLNMNIINSSVNALKLAAVSSIIISPFLLVRTPRYLLIAFVYPLWLIIRDVVAMLSMATAGTTVSILTSASTLAILLGLICLSWLIASQYEPVTILRRTASLAASILAINFVVALWQFVSFRLGLPINGINSAFTEQSTGGLKWAAYRIAGETFFRPYGFYGEPKFLGAVTVVCFAIVVVSRKLALISNKLLVVSISVVLLTLVLSASTSAMLGFGLVTFVLALTNNLPPKTAAVLLLGAAVGTAFSATIFDLGALLESRINDRLATNEGPLEGHERHYLDVWLGGTVTSIFGLGYAFFGTSGSEFGFRLIPNNPLIWMGVSGGLIAIFFYFLSFCSSIGLRYTLPVFCALLAFSTNSSIFLALIFCFGVRRYLSGAAMSAKT